MISIEQALLHTLLPAAVLIVSGVASLFVALSARVTSGVQHFAAGVVFVAVAVELLPSLMQKHAPIALIIGFALGTVLMLGIRYVFEGGGEAKANADNPTSLLAAVGIDLFIDGFLVGIASRSGKSKGCCSPPHSNRVFLCQLVLISQTSSFLPFH